MTTGNITYLDESAAAGWERTLYAFLAEKERRSGSKRTVQSYSRMLHDFFGRTGKTPNEVSSQGVFTWGYGVGLSGREPSSITIGARVACLSSFYRFLIRMKVVTSNPCDALERPRVTVGVPKGLSADGVQRLLAVIPNNLVGPKRPRHHPHASLQRTPPRRGLWFEGGRPDRRRWPDLLRLSRQGRQDGTQGTADAGGRGDTGLADGFRTRPREDEGRSLGLAQPADRRGDHLRHLLHQPTSLPGEGWPAACRGTCLPSQRGEAQARCRRVGGGGVEVLGPQQPGGHDHIPFVDWKDRRTRAGRRWPTPLEFCMRLRTLSSSSVPSL